MTREISALLREALTCSIFVAPTDPGLDDKEILAIGKQAGYQDGEIWDAFQNISKQEFGRTRYVPTSHDLVFNEVHEEQEIPLLNVDVANFIIEALNERAKADGIQSARLDRDATVERAIAAGHDRTKVEGAFTCLLLTEQLFADTRGIGTRQLSSMPIIPPRRRRSPYPAPVRATALGIVQDVVSRRTDGRPKHAEPLDAFPDALDSLGFRSFKVWWMQTAREMRSSDPTAAATARIVLAAALVEGALTFVVHHARSKGLAVFQSPDFQRGPETWKINDLIKSAATGGKDAVLTQDAKSRAETLARSRQRIHAGRMMVEHPGGPPDIRPDDARDAKTTAEMVTRQVLEWLGRNPPN